MKIRILTANDVKSALPMPKAIEAMKRAFGQFSAGHATVPLRERVATDKGVTLLMPAFLHQSRDFALKVVSIYHGNPKLGLPTVSASVLVLDAETGLPKAFMEGDSLTALRTGAAGGMAVDLLAREDVETAALFGAGIQAPAQLRALMAVRSIKRVYLVDISEDTAQRLADEVADWPQAPEIILNCSPKQAVQAADMVITATTSKTPVFDGNDLQSGTHVTGIGSYAPDMQEIDEMAVKRASIFVDSRESCMAEAGDLIISKATIDAEIGEVINGVHPGRRSDDEITFFKSVGVAVQDAVAAAAVLKEAEDCDIGQLIEMS